MKIVTWNVNGIRSLKTPLKNIFEKLGADVICFQETKFTRSQVDHQVAFIDGYSSYFSFPRHQSGYSGVATYVSDKACPVKAEEGLSDILTILNKTQDVVGGYGSNDAFAPSELQSLDGEGRALITKHLIRCKDTVKNLAVINVYCPRADPEKPERASFKMQFYKLLQSRAEALVQCGCHVLVVGDVNTSHKPIDHCDPGEEEEFSLRPSRKWMDQFLRTPSKDGTDPGPHFIDSFRYFHPNDTNAFTCWCNVTGARKTNYGTRIDYIICDSELIPHFSDTVILPEIEGSDHCPVAAIIDVEPIAASKFPALCTYNWPEFSGKQIKISNFLTKGAKTVSSNTQVVSIETKSKVQPPKRKNSKLAPEKQRTIASFFKKSSVNVEDKICSASVQNCDDSPPNVSQSNQVSPETSECEISNSQSSDTSQYISSQTDDINLLDFTNSESCQEMNGSSSIKGNEGATSENKNSQANLWKNLLSGPEKPPLCKGHQEPCVLRTVKKQGPNLGRQFYVCARPDGHANNPEARCNHFQWFSIKRKKIS